MRLAANRDTADGLYLSLRLEAVVTRSPNANFVGPESRMASFWIPPHARGNGLPAARWAEIILVSRAHADELLDAFRVAGVPACAALARERGTGDPDDRVWVDPDHYAAAENVLLHEMWRRAGQ